MRAAIRILAAMLAPALVACASPAPAQRPAGAEPALPPGIARLGGELVMRPCDRGLCFYDASGAMPYWVRDGHMHSAEVLARQERYNAWAARRGARAEAPQRIAETGRLDFDTLAIPYYRSVLELAAELEAFARDCAAGADASLAGACAAIVRADEASVSRLEPGLRLRAVTLRQAALESAAYAKALRPVPRGALEPDRLGAEVARELQAADLRLAGAVAQAQWAARAYASRRGR